MVRWSIVVIAVRGNICLACVSTSAQKQSTKSLLLLLPALRNEPSMGAEMARASATRTKLWRGNPKVPRYAFDSLQYTALTRTTPIKRDTSGATFHHIQAVQSINLSSKEEVFASEQSSVKRRGGAKSEKGRGEEQWQLVRSISVHSERSTENGGGAAEESLPGGGYVGNSEQGEVVAMAVTAVLGLSLAPSHGGFLFFVVFFVIVLDPFALGALCRGVFIIVLVCIIARFRSVSWIFLSSFRLRPNNLKSPWSRRRRKRALSPHQWNTLFSEDGRLRDGGVKFLKKVRSGGVDERIRADVWPFLLGVCYELVVDKDADIHKGIKPQPPYQPMTLDFTALINDKQYDLNSSKADRISVRTERRKEYESLRRLCRRLLKRSNYGSKKFDGCKENGNFTQDLDSCSSEEVVSARDSLSSNGESIDDGFADHPCNEEEASPSKSPMEDDDEVEEKSTIAHVNGPESSDSESSVEDSESMEMCPTPEMFRGHFVQLTEVESLKEKSSGAQAGEDFATWQRIIRVDAVRASSEWVVYSPAQAAVSESRALRAAEAVGLKDYDHLEPSGVFHAARLVAILEAYAVYDPEIGYCQGMSDLLSPIVAVMEEDHEAFWCFVGFMKKARHNFRLDEVGIRRQLGMVSKIIKSKDSHLYKHLEKLKAEDCFFVYRMVVVLFRRELSFEQTVCLWEVMWADQAAIRAGIGKSAWGRIRQRAPPTDDLLLYAIAACVLQKKKLIIEKYSSMDEIIRECNNMAGQLDVWKLLDDAHDLVVTLHDKIR
ncbi:hypothetical protein ACLOJK_006252 [Asimina triloba]